MPVNMRLTSKTEAPSEETPPSTRPSSAASNSTSNSGPQRSTSMDSIHTSSSLPEKSNGEEVIPTRFTQSSPRVNVNSSMQFVKTKPVTLYKTAKEQIIKTEEVKSLRKICLREEEEYETSSSIQTASTTADQDWQSNLDKWKNTRRKRNEVILERVIESKKFEEDTTRGRKKSKTFSEMRQEKDKRGRRYNIVVHNDDNNDNDLSELGITPSAKSSIGEQPEEVDKDVDNKDAKSDAGFCTGSDTGSDGVFAEDNISDTSSALGDKKESIDLLSNTSSVLKSQQINGISNTVIDQISIDTSHKTDDCTFGKTFEKYKQFSEKSKMKSTSMTNITQILTKNDMSRISSQKKLQTKLGYFTGDLAREERIIPKMRPNKGKVQKIDVKKRRSMFELREMSEERKADQLRSSFEMSESLKGKVSSFEQQKNDSKISSIIPPRDVNFKEKLAAFNQKNQSKVTCSGKVPGQDKIYEKFHNSSINHTPETKIPLGQTTSLKQKIASFERSSPDRTKSISTECLSKMDSIKTSYFSAANDMLKRSPSTPFFDVDVDTKMYNEPVDSSCLRDKSKRSESTNRKTVYEEVNKCEIKRDTEAAAIYSIFSHSETQNTVTKFNNSQESIKGNDSILNGTYLEMGTSIPQENISNNNNSRDESYMSIHNQNDQEEFKEACDVPNNDFFPPLPPLPSICDRKENLDVEFDSLEAKEEYGDDDIDEVIQDYEQIKIPNFPPEDKFLSSISKISNNTYENIEEDLTFENIYEQLDDSSTLPTETTRHNNEEENLLNNTMNSDHTYQSLSNNTLRTDHTYQSLEELQEEMKEISPPLPPKKSSPLSLEVLDVSWTEDCGRPNMAIPPSIPPPPPPPEDEEGMVVDGGMVIDTEISHSRSVSCAGNSELSLFSENLQPSSDVDNKKILMLKRSQFLGTTAPPVTEEVLVKPPPDMKEFIRHERDLERQLIQKKSRKNQSDLDLIAPARFKYTWEDRMRQDSSNDLDTSDTSSNLEFQCKLHELELEMEVHDREMLQRANMAKYETAHNTENVGYSSVLTNEQEDVPLENNIEKKPAQIVKSLPIQEFYSTPVQEINPPQNSSSLVSKALAEINDSVAKKSKSQIPAPNVQPPPKPSRSLSETNIIVNRLNKPSIKTLSAIPKPKRVENDSWIAKKKTDNSKRNYNSHWLIQEAEQRRIDSLARQTSGPALPFRPANLLPSSITYNTAPPPPRTSLPSRSVGQQQTPSLTPNIQPSNLYASDSSNIYANTSNYSNSSSNSSSENINCKMKGITYNPQKPSPPQKPLPASIISTITQRVSNKGRINNNNNERSVVYRNNNHDYMNAEAIRTQNDGRTEILSTPLTANVINARNNPANIRNSSQNSTHSSDLSTALNEEQRLLSVSGKKKCSHCCEELGRGAAMIIESLRLFYHIPCFKCCVCGTQLGNGTAGADVRVRNHKLHCHNCYSNDEGMKFSKV